MKINNIIDILEILDDYSTDTDWNESKDSKVIIKTKGGHTHETTAGELLEKNNTLLHLSEEDLIKYDFSEQHIAIRPNFKTKPYFCTAVEAQDIESITIWA